MGREITVGGGGEGAFADSIYRRVNGQVVAQSYTQEDRAGYVLPAVGVQAKFQLTGITETFEMQDRFADDPNATKTKVRLEFQVLAAPKGAGNATKMLVGKRFSQLETWSLNEKSNMGRLFAGLLGRQLEKGESINPDDFIGVVFVSTTRGQQSNPGKFAGISAEAILRDHVDWSQSGMSHLDAEPEPEPEPELVGAAVGGDEEDDPFLVDF